MQAREIPTGDQIFSDAFNSRRLSYFAYSEDPDDVDIFSLDFSGWKNTESVIFALRHYLSCLKTLDDIQDSVMISALNTSWVDELRVAFPMLSFVHNNEGTILSGILDGIKDIEIVNSEMRDTVQDDYTVEVAKFEPGVSWQSKQYQKLAQRRGFQS